MIHGYMRWLKITIFVPGMLPGIHMRETVPEGSRAQRHGVPLLSCVAMGTGRGLEGRVWGRRVAGMSGNTDTRDRSPLKTHPTEKTERTFYVTAQSKQ